MYVVGPHGGGLPWPVPLVLCGRALPWVEQAEHLGHTLHQDRTMQQDCREKLAQFINSSVKVRECFHFAHLHEKIVATKKYCTSLYGSNLWNLASDEVEMVIAAWQTGHKLAWDIHCGCHTYLLQTVLLPNMPSLRTNIICKF